MSSLWASDSYFCNLGSGVVQCPDCKDGIIRFDFISKESLKKNQEKHAEFIKSELEKQNFSTNYEEYVLYW